MFFTALLNSRSLFLGFYVIFSFLSGLVSCSSFFSMDPWAHWPMIHGAHGPMGPCHGTLGFVSELVPKASELTASAGERLIGTNFKLDPTQAPGRFSLLCCWSIPQESHPPSGFSQKPPAVHTGSTRSTVDMNPSTVMQCFPMATHTLGQQTQTLQ